MIVFCIETSRQLLMLKFFKKTWTNLLPGKTWGMHFNIDKCIVLRVTLKHNPFTTEYFLDNQKLSSATKAKYLGVIFDNKLTFNHHVDSVCQKANQTLSFLRRNLNQCNRRVKLDTYNCSSYECRTNFKLRSKSMVSCCINKLEKIQKRAACFIFKDYWRTSSVSRMLNSLNLKYISYVHTKMRLLMLFKIVHKLVELPLPIYISNSNKSGTRGNEHKLNLPHFTVDSYKFSFFPRSIILWNKLPITNDCTLTEFEHWITNPKILFLYSNFCEFYNY